MKKKSEYLNEMEYIKDWCITVIDYILEMKDISFEVKAINQSLKNGLVSNFNSSNKNVQKGIKDRYRIMKEEVSYWPDNMKANLDNILYSKFGETISQIEKEKEIIKIIKRGKINNDDEFKMIDEKVNEICQTSPKSSELDKLNHLLLKYEKNQKQYGWNKLRTRSQDASEFLTGVPPFI